MLKLNRPPFRMVADQPPGVTAEDIIAAFESIELASDKVTRVFVTLCGLLRQDADDPRCVAGRALAAAIDAGGDRSGSNAYHNPQHFCEAMLSAHFLCLLQGLCAHDAQLVVLAALVHDFHHDGSVNGDVPFRLERIALHEAAPYLVNAGVSSANRRSLEAMVLATDVAHALDFTARCHAHHSSGAPLPGVPALAPELAGLQRAPLMALQALVLCQADLLPSTGLTPQYAMRMQNRLAQEWGRPLLLEDKLSFLDQIDNARVTCRFFAPNLRGIRQAISRVEIAGGLG